MDRDDRDLGINVDSDPEPEVMVYDDDLARKVAGAGIVLAAIYLLSKK